MKYQRYFQPGGTFFFTVVTCNRRKIFVNVHAFQLFHQSIEYVQQNHPFQINAYCICPDHIHMIWTLPDGDSDYPTRWRLIKSYFSRNWSYEENIQITPSRTKKNERMIWQRRYWEHFIKDEFDLKNHVDYINYNPVKHKYVKSPLEWKESSFSDYVSDGLYACNWASEGDMNYLDKFGKE
jgi:putative transposase